MPSWGEILGEMDTSAGVPGAIDSVRRKYIKELATLTGRSVVVYASDYLGAVVDGSKTSISLLDMQGLMEVFRELSGPNLDLILHSPGGQVEATESLVKYMRTKFDHIRVFVPLAAMSAATMWAMAADEIVMGKHSQLGPIDPQVTLQGGVAVPAGALIDQFNEVLKQCAEDPKRITGWLPTLQQYVPGLLNICQSADSLSKQLVAQWLAEYMFKGEDGAVDRAKEIADWLGSHKSHLSHSRPITRDDLQDKKLHVTNLESDPLLQDAVLSVHHAVMLTFVKTSAVKLVENNIDRAWMQLGTPQAIPQTTEPKI